MSLMTLDDAMRSACAAVGIAVPRRVDPGRWAKSPVIGKAASNTSGRVMIFDDRKGGIAHNWANGQQQIFRLDGADDKTAPILRRDPEKERRQQDEQAEVARICQAIVRSCTQEPHPYLARKGFPTELGLVHANPRQCLPSGKLGDAIASAMPEGPCLIVPGRVGKAITTVQFITLEGAKKNILRGIMSGASHRIAAGRQTWVCEGIATAMSVSAGLKLAGVSATVLCAFAAANVAKVAKAIPGAFIAADHDKPVESLGGLGTGEYYARQSGCKWVQPPALGDFNDMHQADGLRALAVFLRGAAMG